MTWDQSGGAAARRVRPGLRSLRSPATAGGIDGPLAGGAAAPAAEPQRSRRPGGTLAPSASGGSRAAALDDQIPFVACPCAAYSRAPRLRRFETDPDRSQPPDKRVERYLTAEEKLELDTAAAAGAIDGPCAMDIEPSPRAADRCAGRPPGWGDDDTLRKRGLAPTGARMRAPAGRVPLHRAVPSPAAPPLSTHSPAIAWGLNVRLTAEEKLELDTAARQRGYRRVADFFRGVALAAARTPGQSTCRAVNSRSA